MKEEDEIPSKMSLMSSKLDSNH